MPAAFSRLQLAAALIEYDNDSGNPDIPIRSAQESAIFAHLRRNPAARPDLSTRKSTNHLGVSLRTDGNTTQHGADSVADNRRSLDALRNPFGADGGSEYDDDGQEEQADLEVDLSSWGLDAFIPKEKPEKSKKGKEKQGSVPVRSRTVSGGPNELGEVSNAVAHSRSASTLNMRRQSTASRLDYDDDAAGNTLHRRRALSQASILVSNAGGTVPFPSNAIDPAQGPHVPRSQSRASLNSRQLLEDARELRPRSMSQGTTDVDQPQEDNPFALRPPTHTSRFDPKGANTHAPSIASRATRQLLDNDDAESVQSHHSFTQNRPYSVVELLRPKVLVMPSPLQSIGPGGQGNSLRDGFQLSRDGPPLPPGARTSHRMSMNLDSVPTNPSNSFIPNPSADLTLAQKVFRDTLVIHNAGQHVGSDGILPRAHTDGEQVEFEPPQAEEEGQFFGADQSRPIKPAGKLYGKSLIDDLETRKAQMRSKQRVFTGDQRPNMMARESTVSGPLIDPATLNQKPSTQRQSSYGSQEASAGLARRGSSHMKPFLSFDEESRHHQQLQSSDRIPKSKSVFGVDTLWEQEMAKLRLIEEQERIDGERRRKEEEEEAKRKVAKHRKKKKLRKRGLSERVDDNTPPSPEGYDEEGHVPEAPPTLPAIKPVIVRKAPQVSDDDEDSNSDEDVVSPQKQAAGTWHSDSEDEKQKAGPLRTTGTGLRNPTQHQGRPRDQSDSEEDLPLAAAKQRIASRYTQPMMDSDEDKPLARVIQDSKTKSPILDIDFDKPRHLRPSQLDSDDEDSQPLGVRASRLMLGRAADDDDDKPLAFHPDQQRRTQYNLFTQQQHNQLMMQAQFQNSVFFNPTPMIPPPFFGPAMMNPMNPIGMVHAPIPIPSPPPMHDENKFLSVDKWRRDVVVDREQL